jgi:hypothetical protein
MSSAFPDLLLKMVFLGTEGKGKLGRWDKELIIIFFIQPLKMDPTEGSETSAKLNLTPGKYPKENIQDSEHGENLKSRMIITASNFHEIPRHVAVFLVTRHYTMNSTIISNSDGCGLIPQPEHRLLRYFHFPESVPVNAGIVLKSRPRPLLFRFQSII